MHWLAVHGAGVLFDFGGWVLVTWVFDPAPWGCDFFNFGAGDVQIILAVVRHCDFSDLHVEQVADVVSHDFKGFGFCVCDFHLLSLVGLLQLIWSVVIITRFLLFVKIVFYQNAEFDC